MNKNKSLLTFIFMLVSPLILLSQSDTKENIDKLLDQWHLAAAQADQQHYFDFIAESGVFIGTDSSENWTKQEFQTWAKPFFDRGKAWTLKANSRNIYIHPNQETAWFDELLYTHSGTWIGSGVLIKHKSKWKLAHYTLSFTIPNDKMKEVAELLHPEN
jgi:hypothetical protein